MPFHRQGYCRQTGVFLMLFTQAAHAVVNAFLSSVTNTKPFNINLSQKSSRAAHLCQYVHECTRVCVCVSHQLMRCLLASVSSLEGAQAQRSPSHRTLE